MSLGGDTFDLNRVRQAARRLESAMDSFRPDDPADFVVAIREYHEVAVYINDRLFEAHGRFMQGHRDDALRSIEAEPNAIDCLRELDAVDAKLPAWNDTFDVLELPRPLRLLTELADDLGSQYDIKHQLATEMRTHRLLALAGAPLEKRVSTLRRLIRLDQDNRFWVQDLTEYEKHCQLALQRELAALDRGLAQGVTPAVAARVDQICSRLSDAEWQEPADVAIVKHAQGVRSRVRALHVREELGTIAGFLADAYRDDDPRRLENLMAQWTRLADEIELMDDDPLAVASAEPREWAREVLDREAAGQVMMAEVAKLSALCTRSVPWRPAAATRHRQKLEAARIQVHQAAERAGRSAEVAEWLMAAERAIKDTGRAITRFWGISGAVAAMIAVSISGGVYWRMRDASREKIVADLVAEADSLRSSNRGADVTGLVDRRTDEHPWLKGRKEVRRLRQTIEDDEQKAEKARNTLARAITEASGTVADVASRLEPFLAFKAIESGLVAARDAVKSSITTMNNNLTSAERILADTKKGGFYDGSTEMDEIKILRESAGKHEDRFRRQIAVIRDAEVDRVRFEIRQLRDQVEQGESISDSIAKIEDMISAIERLAEKERTETGLRGELKVVRESSIRNTTMTTLRRDLNRSSEQGPMALLEEISDVRNKLPPDLRDAAATVVDSKPCVESALVWSAVAGQWPVDILAPRPKIADWLKELIRTQDLPLPYSDAEPFAKRYETLIECLDSADDGGESLAADLKPIEDLLSDKIMQPEVIEIAIGSGTYYTTVAQVNLQPGHFKDENNFDTRAIGLNEKIRQAVNGNQFRVASHAALATSLRNTLVDIKREETGVERGILAMMAEVFRQQGDNPPPPPLLRAKLLTMLVDLARARSFFNDTMTLETLSDELGAKVGDVPWVLSQDPVTDLPIHATERSEAENILRRNGTMNLIDDSVRKKVDDLSKRPGFCLPLEYIGWVDDGGRDGLILSGTPENLRLSDRNGDILAVVGRENGDAAWELVSCGRIINGKASLRKSDGSLFGRPLFYKDSGSKDARK